MSPVRPRSAALIALVFIAIVAIYANHFDNAFQFDDSHTVVDNPHIRSLGNVPSFFTDAGTFSVDPGNQIYRPLVTASLAVDHAVAGGLTPFWFHLSTFLWFLVQLLVMYVLFAHVLSRARGERPSNSYIALAAVAWYGLHPVSAETVNYVVQRGELYAALGTVAAVAVYARFPRLRRYGLYLVPALLGMLGKQTALMFAPLLFAYILLFETELGAERPDDEPWWRHLWRQGLVAARAALPAFALALAYYLFQRAMTAESWTSGSTARFDYWCTQPYVTLHYVVQLVVPTALSADTDRQLVTSPFAEEVVIGVAFLIGVLALVVRTARVRELRVVTFGLVWFLIALVPTAVIPFAEVENDHRMYMPFVGLVLAVASAIAHFLERRLQASSRGPLWRRIVVVVVVAALAAYGYGTYRRNQVWDTNESLWRDVAEKSPRNGRGLMNYGLALMARGDYHGALALYQRAKQLTPNYYVLETNIGIAHGGLGQDREAEAAFLRAQALAPRRAEPFYYHARWLAKRGRADEAKGTVEHAIANNPNLLYARHLRMQLHLDANEMAALATLASSVLRRFPSDAESQRYLRLAKRWPSGRPPTSPDLERAEEAVKRNPTPEAMLALSLQYARADRHRASITVAREALRERPDYAEAYNNIAAGHAALQEWDAAIAAAQEAIRLKPDFRLARNNLAYAQQQRELEAAKANPPAPLAPSTPPDAVP